MAEAAHINTILEKNMPTKCWILFTLLLIILATNQAHCQNKDERLRFFTFDNTGTIYGLFEHRPSSPNKHSYEPEEYSVKKLIDTTWAPYGIAIKPKENIMASGFNIFNGTIYLSLGSPVDTNKQPRTLLYTLTGNTWSEIDTTPYKINNILASAINKSGDLYFIGGREGILQPSIFFMLHNSKLEVLSNNIHFYEGGLQFSPSGELYALGITKDNNKPIHYTAKRQNNEWINLGQGIDLEPNAENNSKLLMHLSNIAITENNIVYVCGTFNRAGNKPITTLATWDGHSWTSPKVKGLKKPFNELSSCMSIAHTKDNAIHAIIEYDLTKWKNPTTYHVICKDNECSATKLNKIRPTELQPSPDGKLYGINESHIVKYDGNSWSDLEVH